MNGFKWKQIKYSFTSSCFSSPPQVQVAKPGGGRVLQRSHPRDGRRQPGAPTEV